MRKLLPFLLAALMLFSACSAEPAEIPYDTVSKTIWLQTPESRPSDYPEEYPDALEQPPLESASSQEDAPAQAPTEVSEPEESQASKEESSASQEQQPAAAEISGEVRATWLSYLEWQELLTGRNETEFRVNIAEAFDHIKDLGLNTVFVQVRPFGDALYSSHYFPWSYVITGTEGQDPGFDPLQVMVEEAKSRKLRIDAWINPYRIRTSGTDKPLSSENPAAQWEEEGTDDVIRYEGGLYLNPGSEKARQLIVDGVREIIENYEVDGIQFDDYFYPTPLLDFDQKSYESYRAQGGELSQQAWRRENVNLLIREVYETVKQTNSRLLFGISPQGNNDINYNEQFIDVAKWLSTEGYVDYICPQIYFGIQNETAPFKSTVESWNRMIKVDTIQLYVGLAPYKIGQEDIWAGTGSREWIENTDLLAKMVAFSREQSHYGGFALYRYASLFMSNGEAADAVEEELKNLKDIL
ncbi:MAG: family 10 glycosylhydrolase [Provencibacterium sp.]|jgi:uncharacterized lipoprotein YddW (UPF0748 family)|nr:family 10 glycosylhydrolase [Provencibacterium sp.]